MKLQGYNITSILTPETQYVISQLDPEGGEELPSFVSMDCAMNEIRRITFTERKNSFYAFYKYSVQVKGVGRMESMRGLNRIVISVKGRALEMRGWKGSKLKVIMTLHDLPTLSWEEDEIVSAVREQFGLRIEKIDGSTFLVKNLKYVKDNVKMIVLDVDSWPLPLSSQLPSDLTSNLL